MYIPRDLGGHPNKHMRSLIISRPLPRCRFDIPVKPTPNTLLAVFAAVQPASLPVRLLTLTEFRSQPSLHPTKPSLLHDLFRCKSDGAKSLPIKPPSLHDLNRCKPKPFMAQRTYARHTRFLTVIIPAGYYPHGIILGQYCLAKTLSAYQAVLTRFWFSYRNQFHSIRGRHYSPL